MVEKSVLIDALKKAKEQAPERKFTESVDMTINLKNIDMAQPKNRIDEVILLPHGNGRVVRIAVLGSGDIVTQARESGVELIMGPEEIERLGGAPREAICLQSLTALQGACQLCRQRLLQLGRD